MESLFCTSLQNCARYSKSTLGGKWCLLEEARKPKSYYVPLSNRISVPSRSSPYTTRLVSISAVSQTKRFQKRILCWILCSLSKGFWSQHAPRSPEGISNRARDHLPFAKLSAQCYTDVWLPAQSVKCSSLEEYSEENKIFNLFFAFNFWGDWSFGTPRENSNLTVGWTPAEYQVCREETARNEVTRRIPEEFGAVEWTFNSPSIVMMKISRGKGRKTLTLKLGVKIVSLTG